MQSKVVIALDVLLLAFRPGGSAYGKKPAFKEGMEAYVGCAFSHDCKLIKISF